MTDEKYTFVSDVMEKKRTARGSHNKRTHCGKGGRVRLPSDNLTRKELNAMNGEVKSYRLNDPMTWAEFKTMPDDLKITYIKLLREKFGVSDSKIAEMMGIGQNTMSKESRRLNTALGWGGNGGKFDKDGWEAWINRSTPTLDDGEELEQAAEEGEIKRGDECVTTIPVHVEFDEPEHQFPTQTMTLNDKETIVRMLGYIEGLATGVCNERLRAGLYTAVETISEVLDKGGNA